ncbi:uncharacterized protein BHQ10_002546 [Talaromyces amestolkiae]|uniref:Phosphoribulokinase/uridine kinase domain-containing protein n=1 Tax=Talaromyces amestolkiae TaxID=1196081 RepID=A0A364KSK6_TALAM|nr:uncharacterized protein BHQ10_002546 [Talaromyces amestolkiae]RAO66534.1 hypothetical protein BHQ10_002546 [Talaromyces amestolkiae]
MEAEYIRVANIIHTNAKNNHRGRYVVAIAGAPGSGKSTMADGVLRHIRNLSPKVQAVAISMDGFHFPRSVLDQFPNREEAYTRRGAPWTFDAARCVDFVRRLRVFADTVPIGDGKSKEVLYAPSFSHADKDPVSDAITISDNYSIIIIEGNYLLLDEPQWREITVFVDLRIFIQVDLREVRERLARRHVDSGIGKCHQDALLRVDGNDYVNGVTIHEKLLVPDIVVTSIQEALMGG